MGYPTSGKGRLGTRVRVRELDSVPEELRGLAGTTISNFGHPDHAAHDVLLEGGVSSQLFWHYQLEDEPLRERRRLPTEVFSRGGL
jgi:hypothetical protein